MAEHDVQVVLHNANGLPEDSYVNTLHFEVNAPDTLAGLAAGLNSAYDTISDRLASIVNGMTVKIYDPGPNPGGPVYQESFATPLGGSGTGPTEVALCLSYATTDNPDSSLPRRRGRIYLGPLSLLNVLDERPSNALIQELLTFGEDLASIGTAGNTTWLMLSRADNSYHKIESIWMDNAWDTQRRRGSRPNLRVVRDVQ